MHDSFGTHATNIDVLCRVLRDAFITQYTPNVLANLRLQLIQETGIELPEVPAQGTLRLQDVKYSRYFFC